MDELKTLLPSERYYLENGEAVEVSPVPFGKLRLYSESVANVISKIRTAGLNFQSISDYQTAFDAAFEEIIRMMMIVISKERTWFDGITIGDGIGLLSLIIEQNVNENAKKNIQRISGSLRAAASPVQSNISSQQDTDGKTSKSTRQSKS